MAMAPRRLPGLSLLTCLGLFACALLPGGCSKEEPPQAVSVAPAGEPAPPPGRGDERGPFTDVTASSGLHFTYRNGEEADQYTILESLGGGVALLDYDGDGLLDIFLTGGGYFDGPDKQQIQGHPCKLYKNLG